MKRINKLRVVLFLFCLTANIFAQSASVTWPLTSNQNPNTPIGSILASPQTIVGSNPSMILWPLNSYSSNGQSLVSGYQSTGWPSGPINYTRYIQFDTNPIAGNNFTVQNVSFKYGDNPLPSNFNLLKAEVWYSIDGWNNRTQITTVPLNYLNTAMQHFSQSVNVVVPSGQTFSLRIFLYTPTGSLAMTPTLAIHNNVIIEGRTSPVVLNNGSICGTKFNDLNGNGKKDSDEQGLSGWTITLTAGVVSMTATTGTDGSYCFNNLAAGTYTLSETQQSGWRQTYPSNPATHTVILSAGQSVTNLDFGNKRTLGSISGMKFNDLNGTGDRQVPTEQGLPNWTINLTGPVTLTATTDANGNYQFSNLPAGTYTVTETNQSGWQQIYPQSPGSYTIVLADGETVFSKDFANRQLFGSICGTKFNDLNGNGKKDSGEQGLSGWTITLSNGVNQTTAITDKDGKYCFNNIAVGRYTVSETQQNGWQQTYPASPGTHTVKITAELNLIGIDFGNKEVLNPNCTDFENNSLSGWTANNISTSILQSGNNHYVQTADKAGASTFYTTNKPLTGNWTSLFSKGCGSLCFDVSLIYGGDVYNGQTPPQTLSPYIAIEGNGFTAYFIVNQQISVGDGWHSYCAPLSFLNSDGTLPSNSSGYWIMITGNPSDWNSLLTNVTKVRLPVDPTSFQGEKIGYDNICLKNTGDCNTPTSLGSICGIKILDKNGNGIKDSNEDGISNWTIYLNNGSTTISTTTDANGNYCFSNLPAGSYKVSEENRQGWRQIFPAAPGIHSLTLSSGQNLTNINFSNVEDVTVQLGSICGIKFNDINGNGRQDAGEFGLPNWQFNLTGAANMTATTDLNGNFCFTNLKPGDYIITEVPQNGWEVTAPNLNGTYTLTLLSGQNLTNIKFGNKEKLGSICGIKYNDLNGNGKRDEGEPVLPGWQISLSTWGNAASGNASGPALTEIAVVTTDKNGEYCFNNLKQGNYLVGEYPKAGWTQKEPSTFTHSVKLDAGQKITGLNFGNKEDVTSRLGSICGIKFNDKNGNGAQDVGELGIPDWQINLGGPRDLSVYTDKEGKFCFDNLPAGEYKVGETMRNGWRQTAPTTNYYIIQLAAGQAITNIKFGNKEDKEVQLGSICGNKFNDRNRDGRKTEDEPGIANWIIYLDGPMNLKVVTDEKGNYCFYGLIPGTYTVREENKTGWRQTKPSTTTYTLEVGNGNNFNGIDFGNAQDPTVTVGSICGIKFNDLNGDGIKQDNEPGIPNWTINLSGAVNLTTRTDSRGQFCFEILKLGRYTLSELNKEGWVQTAPSTGSFTIELSEDNINPNTFYFGNKEDVSIKLGSICGIKFDDKNGNGRKDVGESGIAGWQINLGGPVDLTITTDRNGNYCFNNLKQGVYVIKEEEKKNWKQTYPASPNSYTITLNSGQTVNNIDFGNKYEPEVGCVTPPSGMKAWWSFDFSSKDSPQDFAGYNNFGNKINGPTAVAGKVLGALQFDGVDDYVEVANHSELNFGTGDFSFDAWIKTTSNTGVSPLVDKRDNASRIGYLFFLNNGNLSVQLNANGIETNYTSTHFVADGNWHHIAVTVSRKSKTGIIFYLDGVAIQSGDPTPHSGSLNNIGLLRIGREFGVFASIFKGILDEIELFNRVLTSLEVQSLYNAGSAGKCKPTGGLSSASGHVYHDLNSNSIFDAGEKPLTNWTILINGPTTTQTQTDDEGNFIFADLKPGDYTLTTVYLNNWSCSFPLGGKFSFKLEEGESLSAHYFGFTNDPCGTGNKSWYPLISNSYVGTNNDIMALVGIGNDLYAGGYFTSAGGVSTNFIGKWNGSIWSPLGSGTNGPVFTLAVLNGELYAAGNFTVAGGVNANRIAKWNGTNWSPLGSGMNAQIQTLAIIGGELYAGGDFTIAGGISVSSGVAKWNGANWIAVGSGSNPYISSLVAYQGELYAAGGFYQFGSVTAHNIAKWNGANWSAVGAGLNSVAYSLTVLSGNLYVSGSFSIAGGVSASRIAKWDGANWSALSSGFNGNVYTVVAFGGELYAGGNFSQAGGVSANDIAKWNGSNWSALGNGMPGSGAAVRTLTALGGDLFAAGEFGIAGTAYASNISRYSCESTITSIEDVKIENTIPSNYKLEQSYPNPFNPTTTIRYALPKASNVKITVYDILGREISVLVNEEKQSGVYEVKFNGVKLASGVYFYTIRTESFSQTKKFILMK